MTLEPSENFLRGGGGAGGTVEDAVADLKEQGCAVLVTGQVSEEILARECRSLFGGSGADRYRVLALTDGREATDYLPVSSTSDDATWVINLEDQIRSVAANDPYGPPNYDSPSTAALRWELGNAITHYRTNDLDSGMVRLAIHSLSTLLDEDGDEQVYQLLGILNQQIRAINGMSHYIYPVANDREDISDLMEACDIDIRIQLRKRRGVRLPEEKWVIPAEDAETEWVPFTDPEQ